jgi:hypothetical protein
MHENRVSKIIKKMLFDISSAFYDILNINKEDHNLKSNNNNQMIEYVGFVRDEFNSNQKKL